MALKMKQIAAKAGVSVATVSRALNKPDKVLPETREKILQIIKELNYAPNPLAKALSTGGTNFIALVVPTLDNSFFAQLAEGCQTYLLSHSYNLIIICGENYFEGELGIFKSIDQRQIKGILLSGSGLNSDEYQYIFEKVEVPVVLIENVPKNYSVSSVYINDIAGIKAVIDHFKKTGHKRIGIITGEPELITTQRRLKYVKEFWYEKNSEQELIITPGIYSSYSSGSDALKRIWETDDKPTAIFTFNDVLAIGAMKAAQGIGIRIPDELSIIGFDDIPIANYCTPALSTVHSPSQELGEEAAKLLLEKMSKEEKIVKDILLPVKLVIRESCK